MMGEEREGGEEGVRYGRREREGGEEGVRYGRRGERRE